MESLLPVYVFSALMGLAVFAVAFLVLDQLVIPGKPFIR